VPCLRLASPIVRLPGRQAISVKLEMATWDIGHRSMGVVIPHSEKEGTKPPYVCPGCSNHTHGNNMINKSNVIK
jgi:hypothetical protein